MLAIVLCVGSTSFTSVPFNDGVVLAKTPIVEKYYPNPATSFIQFNFSELVLQEKYSLEIYSFMGKKITKQRITSSKITLTIGDDYYRGIYVFIITDATGRALETGRFQVVK